ncbi:MAG: cytochrome ubiquinol oxidase subunit I [Candidatus Hydrothermales bacterium]
MSATLLSRIQFGLAAGFHFLFPPTTFGLTLLILIFEILHLKKKEEIYLKISNFLIKILGIVFVLGVASGIVLEFAFGNNWSNYSRMVGDIFGAPLAAEGVFAFFLESVFLGVLIFGRNKVSKKFFLLSAFLVFFASHLSGFWIIVANSWMQTPMGFKIEGGRAVLTNFFEAVMNKSTLIRYIHTIIAGWITGSLLVAGISAYYLLKERGREYAKILLRTSLIIFIITSIIQLFTGHFHSVQVSKTQPEKMAAYEALWETQSFAPFSIFAIPDEKNEKNILYIGIPGLLSFLIDFNPEYEVKGLKDFPSDERPPVILPFYSYHIMIYLGIYFILLSLVGIFLFLKKKIYDTKWYLKILLYSIPLPYFANEFGWIAAEVGRQPWAVYKVLKTKDAISPSVSAPQVLFSLIMLSLIYLFLLIIFIYLIKKIVKKGIEGISYEGY